jgi:hypothetical protein
MPRRDARHGRRADFGRPEFTKDIANESPFATVVNAEARRYILTGR